MEKVGLYCAGRRVGDVSLSPEGTRTEVRLSMGDPGDGLYRASLCGDRGECPLGVLAPENGRLELTRRLYGRELAALGKIRRGEVKQSFHFQKTEEPLHWQETARPAQLFQDTFYRSRLRACGKGWWRRVGERLYVALPLTPGQPFPLEAIFCLASVTTIEGQPCAVYVFQNGEPLPPEK